MGLMPLASDFKMLFSDRTVKTCAGKEGIIITMTI